MTYDYGDDAGAGFDPPRPFTDEESRKLLVVAHMIWREQKRLPTLPDGSEKNGLRKWLHDAQQEFASELARHNMFDGYTWTHEQLAAAGLERHGLPVQGLVVRLEVDEVRGRGTSNLRVRFGPSPS